MNKFKKILKEYSWKERDFPSNKKDWKMSQLNKKLIALNILYVPYNTEENNFTFISSWESKGLSNEKIGSTETANYNQ